MTDSPKDAPKKRIVLSDAELSAPMTNRERVLMLAVYHYCEGQEGFAFGESMWGLNPATLFVQVMHREHMKNRSPLVKP